MIATTPVVTRFAPSPTGYLHLGHGYSAVFAAARARETGGRFLLRIEDIDRGRCRPEFERGAIEDLAWLGLAWEQPARRQSDHMADYAAAITELDGLGVLYPCFCTRAEIAAEVAAAAQAPHGPDGPRYPGTCRRLGDAERAKRIGYGRAYALRLDVEKAAHVAGPLTWTDLGKGAVKVRPETIGDVVIARKETPTSYHLAVSRGALFHLLRNRIYLGMIVHKGRAHPGRHQAIIDGDLFEAVQARLDANTRRRASNREQKSNAPLAGRLFDVDGRPMSPTFSYGRGGKLYRYYVSAPLQQGARRDQSDTAIRRIAAPPLEVALATVLRRVIPGCPDAPITLVVRAELHDQSLHCLLPIDRIVAMRERLEPHERVEPDPVDARLARLHLPLVRRRGQTWVLKGPSAGNRPDPVLVKALRSAHAMLHQDDAGLPVLDAGPDTPYRRRLVRLAFLAPEIQRAIVEGRQSAGVTLTQLLKGPIPLVWSQQAVQIGIATSPE